MNEMRALKKIKKRVKGGLETCTLMGIASAKCKCKK
jgi:hypothetical protein